MAEGYRVVSESAGTRFQERQRPHRPGEAYYNLGRPEDALREYRKSLEADPNHQPTIFNSIVVQLDGTHDLAGAQQAWERLNKMNPSYPGLDNMKKRLEAAGAPVASSQGGR